MEILEKIRSRYPELPVFIITGFGHDEAIRRAMDLGAAAYFAKPFHNRDLAAAIERTLLAKKFKAGSSLFEKRLAEKLEQIQPRGCEGAKERRSEGARGKKAKWAIALTVLFLSAAVLTAYWLFGQKERVYPLPFTHPSAVVWQDSNLWLADWLEQKIYRFKIEKGNAVLNMTYDLKGIHITGLAVAGEFAYVADSWQKTIRRYRIGPASLEESSADPSPGPKPSCLYWDGESLWSCDSAESKIYRHGSSPSQITASFNVPAKSPAALFKEKTRLWLADSETGKIYKLKTGPQIEVIKTFSAGPLNDKYPLSGFAVKNKHFWIVRDGLGFLSAQKRFF
ncbi:MAG: response regulator transcription factor [Elusimicrobia bacterium]|nr:response regulator transcription factor [Elusimicrobiota bacterium]